MRPHRDLRLAIAVWGTLAVVCLVAGLLLGRFGCYIEVRNWMSFWRSGTNVYGHNLGVDYPPNALVFLFPLSLFSAQHGQLWFAGLNSVICVATAWVIVSLTSGYAGLRLTRPERLAYVLMLLVWSPTRVAIWAGQTTPFLILCCCLSLRLVQWSPVVAGVLLAVGASKPHVALGFVLMAMFCRMWKMVAVSAVTTIGAIGVYAASVARSPVEIIGQYLSTLFRIYGGPGFFRGDVDLRPFFVDLASNYATGEWLFLSTMMVSGLALLWLIWRARKRIEASVWVLAAGLMWTTAFLPINRYGLLLIAPTVLLTLWRTDLTKWALDVVAVAIALIVADLPTLVRHVPLDRAPALLARLAPRAHYIDRLAIAACLMLAFTGLARASRPALTDRASA